MSLLGKQSLKCSFCGKTAEQVTHLVAGGGKSHTVYICAACVDLCVGIIKAAGPGPHPNPR